MSLTDAERFPLINGQGRKLLDWMRQHPHAPKFNHCCGDRLTAEGLEQVRTFERELRTAPQPAAYGEIPSWVQGFAARCLQEVPFYRRRGGRAEDFRTLPPCDRADLGRAPWDFVPDSEPLDDLIVYETSGTTGHPLFILSHPVVSSMYLPALRLALERHGVTLEGGPGRVSIILVCAQNLSFTYPSVSAYLDGAGFLKLNLNPLDWRDPDDRARYLDACAPEIFTGDPFSFAQLAQLPLKARPKALVSTAMALLPGLRRELEARFGCPVIDLYSLNESRLVAVGTEEGHKVVPHDLWVEILRPDGAPCAEGERGEIVITGGRNPYLRLLRYRTGDFAGLEMRGGRRVLAGLEGRAPVFFRGADGRIVNNIDVSYILKPCALAQFTLHQAADRTLIFRRRGGDAGDALVRRLLLKVFGAGQKLVISELREDECRNGKVLQYTSDLAIPPGGEAAFQSITWQEVMHPDAEQT